MRGGMPTLMVALGSMSLRYAAPAQKHVLHTLSFRAAGTGMHASPGVAVGVAMGVTMGVTVGVTVGVTMGVAVGVTVGVTVGVAVSINKALVVCVTMGVAVGVAAQQSVCPTFLGTAKKAPKRARVARMPLLG